MNAPLEAEGQEQVHLENFDPAGPQEQELNSPRSLEACRLMGIDPPNLFLLSREQFVEQYKNSGGSIEDVESQYEAYVRELEDAILQLRQVRQQLVQQGFQPGRTQTRGKKRKGKGKKKQIAEIPASGDEEQELEGQPQEGFVSLKPKRSLNRRTQKKARPQSAAQPSTDMMQQFQTTQYLSKERPRSSAKKQSQSSTISDSNRYMQESPEALMMKAVQREELRQQRVLQALQRSEETKQALMQKSLQDAARQKIIQMQKQAMLADRKAYNQQKEMHRLYKIQSNKQQDQMKLMTIEHKNKIKSDHVNVFCQLKQRVHVDKALWERSKWSQKLDYLQTLKDREEFIRGMNYAQIMGKSQRFQQWLEQRELFRKQKQMIFQQIEKRRQDVQKAYEQAKRDKEIENYKKLEMIKQQNDMAFVPNQMMGAGQDPAYLEDAQPRKSRKSKRSSKRARLSGDVENLRNIVRNEVEKHKQLLQEKANEILQAMLAKQEEVKAQNMSDEDKQRLLQEIEAQATSEQQELEAVRTQEILAHFNSMGIDEQTVQALLSN